jgi:CRISPR-associated protein Csd1
LISVHGKFPAVVECEAKIARLVISTEQDQAGTLVAVHDSGPGIDPAQPMSDILTERTDGVPREAAPSMWRMLIETAVQRKSENIQPNLAGEWLRAILSGTPYPRMLLSTLIMRLRVDRDVNALRVAVLKSVLVKNFDMEVPVAIDPTFTDQGYLLGRLFALYEQVQTAALGRNVNATIKDKYYGAGSAQPRKVFHLLESGSANHLSKIGKQKPGLKISLEKQIGAIMDMMEPAKDPFPASLPDKGQALFGLGYYHQRNEFFRKPEKSTPEDAVA